MNVLTFLAIAALGLAGAECVEAGCDIPPLPGYSELPVIHLLPDPFLSMDGSRIEHRDDWDCRRAEIAAQVQEYELGPKPAPPQNVAGSFTDGLLNVKVADEGREISFAAEIEYPPTGSAPFPAMIILGSRTGLDATGTISGQGVAKIYLQNDDIAEQKDSGSRGKGKFYDLYPEHPAGALMVWAWGASRLIDALEQTPGANIDTRRLGVTGCSRNGKGALVVGAFDERIALTIPQEPGAGGASLWRMADDNQQAWIDAGRVPEHGAVQTLAQIVTENVWFRDSFKQFSTTATKLPFDQHMVMGLVAPRALLMVNNTDMYWLDRQGSHLAAVAAHDIWAALGVSDRMGAVQRGGSPHCSEVPQPQLDAVAAYVAKFLVGGGIQATGEVFTDGDFPDLRDSWIDWQAPALE